MPAAVIIATSIAPGKIELQQAAIASWRKLGFRVLSVNTVSEIVQLKSSFPDLNFVEAQRDASIIVGRPLIYFDDILQALSVAGADVCGIVNADVQLHAGPDFPEFIRENVDDGFLFGARVDVASLTRPEGELYEEGFDYFFFNRKVISVFPPSDFCLGAPWWDYWAPLIPLLAGVPVKELLTPVAFHLLHDANWDDRLYADYGRKLLQYVSGKLASSAVGDLTMPGLNLQMLARLDLPNCGRFIANYIKQNSANLLYQHDVAADAVSSVGKGQYLELRGKFLKAVNEYLQTELALASLVDHLQECEADRAARLEVIKQRDEHINAMETSFSWKVTKYLRWLHAKVMG